MVTVSAGIIERNGLILVCQRKKGSRYELKWEFPGGKAKTGEDPKKALHRELVEELGIYAEVGEEIFRQQWRYADNGEFDVRFYAIRKFSGEPMNKVFENLRWVSPDVLRELDLLNGSRGVLRHLQSPV
jgi:8-oxo-dGTP diphosphatase